MEGAMVHRVDSLLCVSSRRDPTPESVTPATRIEGSQNGTDRARACTIPFGSRTRGAPKFSP